jgi:hypothetical protein
MSRRDSLWFILAVPIGVAVALFVGPTYLESLPIWLKLVMAGAGCCVIAAIAVYSRRRAR